MLLKAEEYKKNTQNTQNINNVNNKGRNRKKTFDLNKAKTIRNSSLDKLEINKEVTASMNEEENSIRNINNSINTSTKKHKQKINFKWNKDNNNNKYMMNLKEITRNLAGYH